MKKTYRGYTVQNGTAYARGERFRYPCGSTVRALRRMGAREIVWKNGDFILISRF